MVVTFLYGLLLDFNNFIFVYIFPIVSVMGMASIFLLSKINYTPPGSVLIKETVKKSILRSVSNMIELLRNNRPYLHFEISFMLYGMAFMLSTPVITIFLQCA